MATTTTTLKLTKPAYSETADIQVINNNMETIDIAITQLRGVAEESMYLHYRNFPAVNRNNSLTDVSGECYIRCIGNSFFVFGMYSCGSNLNQSTAMYTIADSRFRPDIESNLIGIVTTDTGATVLSQIKIGTDGTMKQTASGYARKVFFSGYYTMTTENLTSAASSWVAEKCPWLQS